MVAETAKIEPTWNSLRPRSRASGGRIANISVCPRPLPIRQTKSSAMARLRPFSVVMPVSASSGAKAARRRASQPGWGSRGVGSLMGAVMTR